MQVENATVDLERLSESAVVTSKKFVDGSDKTQYDTILIFVESSGGLLLKRVIQSTEPGNFDLLKPHFPDAKLVITVKSGEAVPATRELLGGTMSETEGMSDLVDEFQSAAIASQLRTDYAIVYRFVSSLLAKRFLIATGLSGSGKTKLAQAFARWLTPDPGYVSPTDKTKGKNPNPFYKVVSVGADWSGNENILGYPNGLHPEEYFTKPALELILHAKKDEHKNDPHFLILDEMNLSHVERYFADILSAIESDEKIHLHRDKERKVGDEPIEQEIDLPKNLFIIGTVNIDETTHMFSPKVLDRANVIEFRMKDTELEFFLENPLKPDLNKLDGKGESFGKAFVDAAKNPADVPDSAKLHFQCEMLLFFKVLQNHGSEFGYRVAHEAGRFVHFYEKLGGETDVDKWFKDAFDCIIVQKFLPKLHGSESKLRGVLFSLAHLCANERAWTGAKLEENLELIDKLSNEAKSKADSSENSPIKLEEKLKTDDKAPHYPLSFEKIERMWRAAHENGFASFAES
jgi:energy-coupling factor transporter ATP-binding protein EcfA2